jgi:DNA-binding winged helix-turn-helix (wHTH) protein
MSRSAGCSGAQTSCASRRKAFDVAVALLRHPGRLVSKDELLARVLPDSFVEMGILTGHVSTLRRTLGDETRPSTYIETVARSA